MKKQSFRRHSFGISLFSPNMRSAGIVVLVIVLLLGLFRLAAPGAFVTLSAPLWSLGSSLSQGVEGVTSLFGNAQKLSEDRDRLVEENLALTQKLATAEAALHDLGKLPTGNGIPVAVMARPPIASYDVLVLAGGSKDGITESRLVYGQGGIPIGIIRDVTDSSSRAALFSEAGRESHGWAGEERIPVVLVGAGSGTFTMTVSKDTPLVVGSEVYLPGPGAIPVGMISAIDTDPSSPEAKVHMYPYANPFSLTYVQVGPGALP